MPASTARLALPYPVPDDTVDVPRDVQALAAKLDALTGVSPPLVSVLPAAPADGDECYLQTAAMASEGIIWHFRYRAALAAPYQWEKLGGHPLQNDVIGADKVSAAATWCNLLSGGSAPEVTVPVSGIYSVLFGAQHQISARNHQSMVGVCIGDTNPITNCISEARSPDTGTAYAQPLYIPAATRLREMGLTAGQLIKLRYWGTTTANCWFAMRFIDLDPVRVGP